ncbi:MAG: GntR family transcriptional regulator [Alphaproteobacteria bacterium]|jgi:DNA-binding GntR family transcriptional regulator|nr:GntR family transcriptional regulator [Alphaproteobacteria bacterium]MDP6812135.1 GntR family transcriptional regulator [Alphaproteobacteria bacterium]
MSISQAIPQYRQVAETIRRRILSGRYRQGEIIPPAADLEAAFKVSNITIRKALAILANEGWLSGRRGVGTIVTASPPDGRLAIAMSGNFREWLESADGGSHPIDQQVLDIHTAPAPARVARALGVADDHPLWCMRRLRRLDGAPISYHVNWGAPEQFAWIDADTMADNHSFVQLLRADGRLPLARMEQSVEAIVADRDLSDLLEIAFGEPLYFVENLYRGTNGRVVAVTHLYLRGDRYVYQASIALDDGDAP